MPFRPSRKLCRAIGLSESTISFISVKILVLLEAYADEQGNGCEKLRQQKGNCHNQQHWCGTAYENFNQLKTSVPHEAEGAADNAKKRFFRENV